jgi:hypothetical protein
MAGPALLTGRTAVLATMHGKEQAIAPVMQAELAIQITVPEDFNSDRFGTFTRDIPRPGSQLESARYKALAAMEQTGGDLGIASEGAFGPHPAMPWVACDRELVLLIDTQHQLELVGEALSTATNYRQATIDSVPAALDFAAAVEFPTHALVVMSHPAADDRQQIHKGIQQEHDLITLVTDLLHRHDRVWLETDMRAHLNPSRMAVIQQATVDLVQTIQHTCPRCDWPGFQVVRRLPGLPCSGCGSPTQLSSSWVYGCQNCNYQHNVPYPDGITRADPGQCPFCNP